MAKGTPIRVKYSKEEEEFKVVEGVVDLGYLGTYQTKNISVSCDMSILEDVFEADENDPYDAEHYLPLKPYLREDMSDKEVAEGLSAYYNDRITDIQKHQTELNQMFLSYLLDDCCSCGFPLWDDCSDYIDESMIANWDEDDIEDYFYTDEAVAASDALFNRYYESTHNKDVCEERPAEDIFEKYFPMFKLKAFLADIYGEYLTLDCANVVFQCSGKRQVKEVVCGAYAEITVNNAFYDWHNH